ncbi:MAG: Lrp/AsnC family transcriptional regulator [Candidatus Aenigmarchaeota archaeon]|nr:Lrp/AsnC family transcriptional regulator [Candidatus Aenigmarchaeota archaeon]
MSKIDKESLFVFTENSRTRLKDASVMLKKTPQRLKYSLKVIEDEGILSEPFCIFDYSRFGLILFRVYFKGGYIGDRDKESVIKKLVQNPHIVSIYELSGEFDLAIEMAAPNPSRFNKELKKVADLVKTLNTYKVVLNLVTHIYPRSYLLKTNELLMGRENDVIIGGDRGIERFTDNEMAVMGALLRKPLTKMTFLSKETGMNVRTAKSIVKGLENRNIIEGYKRIVDPNKMGINKFRLFLKLHNVTQERDTEMLDYMISKKEIVQLNRTVGDWDMEVDIEALDKTAIRRVIHNMRQEFTDIIETFNMIEFYQYYKRTYLPMSLFEQRQNID